MIGLGDGTGKAGTVINVRRFRIALDIAQDKRIAIRISLQNKDLYKTVKTILMS
ncbi:MAG: hypothetical protein LBQ30_04845 [Treponema sp.]|jgi:hypothetical protein|nr:hypothetical protein [Treponema sp.]